LQLWWSFIFDFEKMAIQEEITHSRIVNRLPNHFTTVQFNISSHSDIFFDGNFPFEMLLINKILSNTCGRFFYEFKKDKVFLGFEMDSDITFLSLVFSKILGEINTP